MKSFRVVLFVALVLSLVVSGCGIPGESEDEQTAVSVVATALGFMPIPNEWAFDNDSGCAIEIVIDEAALAQVTDPEVAAALAQWIPVVLPAGARAVQINPGILGTGNSPRLTWPFTLKEFVEPDGVADPNCAWLPKDVEVVGPGMDVSILYSVINAQGEIVTK